MGRVMQHNGDHAAIVTEALGIRTKPTDCLAGIEIETGWTTEGKRAAFFRQFDKLGLSDKCISKHDGTIGVRGQTFPSEIVSAPMPLAELRRFAFSVGGVIESFADKGLITDSCGVHIHMSEGMFNDDTLWRFACSISQAPQYLQRWTADKHGNCILKDERASLISETVHAFWSDIALRRETDHCRRLPYVEVSSIRGSRDHSKAFIHGRHTPTFETRIFRTSKSARVIASYVDVIEALYEFSKTPPEPLIIQVERGRGHEWYAEMKRVLAPQLQLIPNKRSTYYDPRNGDQYNSAEAYTWRPEFLTAFGGAAYVPHEEWLARMGRRLPVNMEEYKVMTGAMTAEPVAGWKEGTLPVGAFMEYVIEHHERYPFLAARFAYDKFQSYLRPVKPREYTHREAPHLEFVIGCLARMEYGKGETYEVLAIEEGQMPFLRYARIRDNGERDSWDRALSHPINKFIHACPGAIEPGGEV